jgi:cell division protein FtsB
MKRNYCQNRKNTTTTIRSSCPKSKALFALCACGFVFSLFAQVVVSNQYAVKGAQLEKLLSQQKSLEKDVYALELKISQLSSLSYVEQQAKKQGFVPVGTAVLYSQNPAFALNLQ